MADVSHTMVEEDAMNNSRPSGLPTKELTFEMGSPGVGMGNKSKKKAQFSLANSSIAWSQSHWLLASCVFFVTTRRNCTPATIAMLKQQVIKTPKNWSN